MARWIWPVAIDEPMQTTPRVRVARFGDGYEQRAADGLHTQLRTYSVRLAADHDLLDAAEQFLADRGGVEPFNWYDLKGRDGLWVCRAWSRRDHATGGELTAKFEEVPA